jgi:hypothetical protein
MRVSIIVTDKVVCVDSVCHLVDMPAMPAGLHAVQWYDTWGEEEWVNDLGRMDRNESITSFEPYEGVIELWNTAHQAWLAEIGGLK